MEEGLCPRQAAKRPYQLTNEKETSPRILRPPALCYNKNQSWHQTLRNPTLCREFLEALHDLHHKELFGLHAYVLMPDHIHLIVQSWDGRISSLMAKIKSVSARRILKQLRERSRSTLLERLKKPGTGKKGHTYQVWQQGFHTVELWSEWFIKGKIDYLHANPLRAGLVDSVKDYPWSSFKAFHGLGGYEIPVDPISW